MFVRSTVIQRNERVVHIFSSKFSSKYLTKCKIIRSPTDNFPYDIV